MPLLTKAKQRTVISALRDSNVRDIEQNYNEPAKLWCNEKWITAACLRCSDQRCIRCIDAEISCGSFSDFPYERNLNVCPFDAIKWNFEKELPEIENGKCIGCGLCAARCPVGAIFKADNKMKVSAPESDDYIDLPINYENLVKHKYFVQEVDKIYWNHQFQKESDRIMGEIYEKISHYDGRSMVPNVLVRNLIIALNHECAISRAGDIYTRMDAVYSSKIKPKCSGVVEIEFGRDTLEASRGILDDIAVMHSRNNLGKKDNAALVVCLSFPNKRQGYFQVIKDIHRVLDLKIQTISLGALLLLVWNGAAVNFLSREFYVDFDNLSIRGITEFRLNRHVLLSEGKLGILEPEKQSLCKASNLLINIACFAYIIRLIGGKNMMQIDSAILATDKVICKNISRFDDSERGLLSQNILAQLRNFVEYIADKVYAGGSDLDPNNYALNVEALKHLQTRGDLRFLHQFHELL